MERAGRFKDGASAAGWKDFAAAAERCPSRGSDTGAIGRASNGQPEKICDQSAGDGDRDRYQQPARVHLGRSHAPRSFPADPGYVCTAGPFQRWRIHAIREGEEYFRSPLRKREGREISLQLQGSDRRQETRARYFAESRGHDRGAVTKPMHNLKYISIGGIWLVLLSCAPARAQQQADTPQDQQQGQQPSQPIPAIRSPLATGADNGDQGEAPNPQLMQPDTKLTSRTSLTFVGGYSLLHYFDDNLLNYGDASFQAGYNYVLSRKDTIAVSYNYSTFQYSNVDQSLNLN